VSEALAAGRTSGEAPSLAVRELVVDRGSREVLKGISFEIRRGEIFGFLGPNGAGKTTLFRVLTGLLEARSGSIELEGRRLRTVDAEFRLGAGVVFQEPALDPQLTARENLMLAARLYGVARAAARARVGELLGRVGLEDRADEPVAHLSGGMRRRVELVRALVHEPRLLILDEPTAGLDQRAFRDIWEHLLALRSARGLTLVLNTHNPEEAERCDRLAILDAGRIVACDTPDRLRSRVRGDLVVLEVEDPPALAGAIEERFGIATRVLDGRVVLEKDRAHELIPRLVEAFPDRTLRSVGLRRAGLGEVFLGLTGHELVGEADGTGSATPGRKA
jgi:ABC-2 type transport system ATP-binding protein